MNQDSTRTDVGSRKEPVPSLMKKVPGAIVILLALALTAVFLVRVSGPICTEDLFWQMAQGKHILETGQIPHTDLYSHTASGHEDLPQEWLSEVIFESVFRIAGFSGIRILGGLFFLLGVWAVWSIQRRFGNSVTAASLGVMVFLVLDFWWIAQIRPHMFSLVFVFVYILLLDGCLDKWRLAGLLILQVIWTNLHAVGLLGVVFASGMAGVEILTWIAVRSRRAPAAEPEPEPWKMTGLAVVLAGLSPLTAIGPKIWNFSFGKIDSMKLIIDEWSRINLFRYDQTFPVLSGTIHGVVIVILVLFGMALLHAVLTSEGRSRIYIHRRQLAFALMGAAMGLQAVRFLFALVVPLAWSLAELRAAFRQWKTPPRVRSWAHSACGLMAVILAALLLASYLGRLDHWMDHAETVDEWSKPTLDRRLFPEMCTFLLESGVRGNLWNSYVTGGQLDYYVYPRCRVFIDGRTLVFPEQIIRDGKRIELGIHSADLLDQYGVDIFCGNGKIGISGMSFGRLDGNRNWISAFRSQEVDIRLRRGGARSAANLEAIQQYYEKQGIPFDPEKGFDAGKALEASPAWARRMRILPEAFFTPLSPAVSRMERAQRAFGLGVAFERLELHERAMSQFLLAMELAPQAAAPRAAFEAARSRWEADNQTSAPYRH